MRRNPCLHGGPTTKGTTSNVAPSTVHSRGPKGGRNGYLTSAFSAFPKQGEKIRYGCPNLAFAGAEKRAKVVRNTFVLGGPQTRGQNQRWLPQPYLLGGPKEGAGAT